MEESAECPGISGTVRFYQTRSGVLTAAEVSAPPAGTRPCEGALFMLFRRGKSTAFPPWRGGVSAPLHRGRKRMPRGLYFRSLLRTVNRLRLISSRTAAEPYIHALLPSQRSSTSGAAVATTLPSME